MQALRRWWYVCRIASKKPRKKRNAAPGLYWGANGCGVYVARWLSLRGVGMRGIYGTLDNVYSVGVLRLLSMRIGNTSNSKAARLYALRLYVTRCIYGRTYGAHGIG